MNGKLMPASYAAFIHSKLFLSVKWCSSFFLVIPTTPIAGRSVGLKIKVDAVLLNCKMYGVLSIGEQHPSKRQTYDVRELVTVQVLLGCRSHFIQPGVVGLPVIGITHARRVMTQQLSSQLRESLVLDLVALHLLLNHRHKNRQIFQPNCQRKGTDGVQLQCTYTSHRFLTLSQLNERSICE